MSKKIRILVLVLLATVALFAIVYAQTMGNRDIKIYAWNDTDFDNIHDAGESCFTERQIYFKREYMNEEGEIYQTGTSTGYATNCWITFANSPVWLIAYVNVVETSADNGYIWCFHEPGGLMVNLYGAVVTASNDDNVPPAGESIYKFRVGAKRVPYNNC